LGLPVEAFLTAEALCVGSSEDGPVAPLDKLGAGSADSDFVIIEHPRFFNQIRDLGKIGIGYLQFATELFNNLINKTRFC